MPHPIFTIYTHRNKPVADSSRQTQLHTYGAMSWPCTQCHISATTQTHHTRSPNHSRCTQRHSTTLIVYLLCAHIPGHTLTHGTRIRIQHSTQTQHPAHPHGDTPSLPCAPTHALAFPLDFIRGTTHLHHSPAALHTHINTPYKHTIPPVLSRRTTHLTRVTRQAVPCHGCSSATREEEAARRPSHLTPDTQACATARGSAAPPALGTHADRQRGRQTEGQTDTLFSLRLQRGWAQSRAGPHAQPRIRAPRSPARHPRLGLSRPAPGPLRTARPALATARIAGPARCGGAAGPCRGLLTMAEARRRRSRLSRRRGAPRRAPGAPAAAAAAGAGAGPPRARVTGTAPAPWGRPAPRRLPGEGAGGPEGGGGAGALPALPPGALRVAVPCAARLQPGFVLGTVISWRHTGDTESWNRQGWKGP